MEMEYKIPKNRLPKAKPHPLVFHSINKSGSLSLVKTLQNSGVKSVVVADNINELENLMKKSNKNKRMLIMGHDLYLGHKPDNYELMTQVRNPVARIVSIWSWFRRKQELGLRAEPLVSFYDFIRDPKRIFYYSMVAQFAVPFDLPKELRREFVRNLDPEIALRVAIHRLERDFKFVTVAERFEESLFLVCRDRNIKKLTKWHKDLRNSKRPLLNSVGAEDLQVIQKSLEIDYEIYDYANKNLTKLSGSFVDTEEFSSYTNACVGQYKEIISPDLSRKA